MQAERIFPRVPAVARLRSGVRRQANWVQVLRYVLVGVSGYTVNLVVFAMAVQSAGLDYRLAATVSFVAAVTNNFVWHRRWTFGVRQSSRRAQGTRFLSVSLVVFAMSLLILQLLVGVLGLNEVLAQATALAAVTPLSFVWNKFWSFRS